MPKLQSLKTIINGCGAQGVQSRELKAVLSLYMTMEPQLAKRDIIKSLKEDLTAESLFHKHIVTGLDILYKYSETI